MKWIVCATVLMVAAAAAAQTATPGAGVPLDLATRRAAVISDLRYALWLAIPEDVKAPIDGTTTMTFALADGSAPLVVDFETSRDNVKSITANGKPVDVTYVNGHIVLPAAALTQGRNSVTIAFTAGNDPLNRSSDFLYALFVPARARQAIPVFDQPDLKARWSLSLKYPSKWRAVSNGQEQAASADHASPQETSAAIGFAETQPLPTYLFSFVVGDFKVETAVRNGRTFHMYHRETDAAKVARNSDAIFDLHARAIAFMEQYTGIPYAFGKFDFVLIPAFQFGGMEHAGKILYNATGLMLDESATQNQLLGRASVISHETAHMWFGDLVTMRWFNDVWMKEVFANFMAAKIVNPSFPDVNHPLRFLLSNYPSAYEVDRTAGANPIRQPLDNLNEAGSLYGNIIYQKAPVVMRHLEALLGEDNFRDGLREYLRAHAFANATWTDLIDLLDARTPADLRAWSKAWVDEPGRPTITTELQTSSGRITKLAFHQTDPRGRGFVWPQQLRVTLGDATATRELAVQVQGADVEVTEAVGTPAPRFVLANGAGWAYGDIVPDRASIDFLLAALPDIADPLTRGSAWVTLWDALLDARVPPAAILDLQLRALPKETDEQLTSRILSYTDNNWWRFVGDAERRARAAALEGVLRDGLARAGTTSQKASWFGALRNVSLTPPTVEWLRKVWAKEETVAGLPLAETDFTRLAEELALRQVDGWAAMLKAQLDRIENPDRKARFAFVTPALDADPAVRDRWFQSLKDVANRRREPWVLDGITYLHHPLRARASAGYVTPSLELLREIQRTGDIFFPKRWLDATFSGHSTAEVAGMVDAFLKGLPPDYPDRLRNITLQSADELMRASKLRR